MIESKYREILSSVQNTIFNYDNKASALLTAVGIVFGFSLFSVQELSNKTDSIKVFCYIFGILYLLAFVTSLILLVSIVFPRRRNKKEKKNKIDYPFYIEDLYEHLHKGDINVFVEDGCKDDAIIDQIRTCTRIAHAKEGLLRAAVISLITFTISLIVLVVLLFCE